MKRFLVFFGADYYPSGGMLDFIGDFKKFDEAHKFLMDYAEGDWWWQWGHIWDSKKRKIVFKKEGNDPGKVSDDQK